MQAERSKNTIVLFDVDGTLAKSRNVINEFLIIFFQKIENNMIDVLNKLREKVYIAVVGGSDIGKI